MLLGQRARLCRERLGHVYSVPNRRFGGTPSLSQTRTEQCPPEVKEIEIPVPWGKIAARHWNYKSGTKPVLCVHGWKDNAASFDPLLPLLIKEAPAYHFLAIDLPGHGRSSHFPPGMLYLFPDLFMLYLRILRHFGWRKISIMAHSLGAQFSLMFSGMQPITVDKLIAIEGLSPIIHSKQDALPLIHQVTSEWLGFEDKLEQGLRPTYPMEELLGKRSNTLAGQMSPEESKIIMTRGAEEHPPGSGRYRYTHDIRVHYMPYPGVSTAQVAFAMKNFRSDLLYIKADQGYKKYAVDSIVKNQEHWLTYDREGKPKGNLVKFVTLPGKHHIHLANPESVLPHIANFLSGNKQTVVSEDQC